jgi:hypothetical protein
MASYTCMYTRSQRRIKMRMETIIGLYGKGNEIISWHSLCVGSCLVLSGNYRCMRYCPQSMLHQIWTSQIGYDNVCWDSKTISSDDNIHLSSCVAREKMRNLALYMGFIFYCDSCNSVSKHIMECNALILTKAT